MDINIYNDEVFNNLTQNYDVQCNMSRQENNQNSLFCYIDIVDIPCFCYVQLNLEIETVRQEWTRNVYSSLIDVK